ncbi:MAG TPA: lytic transglycosylase domain-containing protein [Nevskiaceae bacterium]|nr:lytic transglycosylase domain-containing protein [Nevskiaceae bacterium]
MSRQGSFARRIVVSVVAAVVCSAPAFAQDDGKAKIYQHRDANGVRTFSDLKRIRGMRFVGEYARPTAEASCRGMTPAMIETRGTQYDTLFAGYAQSNGIEAALIKAVARIESCFDLRAVSRVGAQGLMQLMPGTQNLLGVSDPFVADKNINGGAAYLRMMLDRFNGDVALALAAYNAGPEAVDRHHGIPPFRETRDYVKRVTEQYDLYRARATAKLQPVTLRVQN